MHTSSQAKKGTCILSEIQLHSMQLPRGHLGVLGNMGPLIHFHNKHFTVNIEVKFLFGVEAAQAWPEAQCRPVSHELDLGLFCHVADQLHTPSPPTDPSITNNEH